MAVVEDAVGPWSKGGRETRYAALLPRLAARGFEVEVFTMRWWVDQPRGEVRYTAICPLVPMYKGERRSVLQAVLFAISTVRLLGRSFDVILADQIPNLHLFPLRVIAWIKKVKLVVQWHEVWGREYWQEYLRGAGGVAARLERVTAHLPDEVIAVSKEIGGRLASLGVDAARITVAANAMDRVQLDAVTPGGRSVELVTVGRLITHKRVDEAIRVVDLLRGRGRDASLVVIGDGPERERLEQLAAHLGLSAQVSFLGALDADEEVWAWLRAARVVVSPSDREGFGLVVAESLALGTPVACVAHPHNDASRLVEDGRTGSVVPPGDLEALASAVERWLDAPDRRAEISARFWATHPELDWELAADVLSDRLTPHPAGQP